MPDLNARRSPFQRIAVFGGVYSNHLALDAVLADARAYGVDGIFCLGDLGGFGPHPDRSADRLRQSDVFVLQGNYDDSVGNGLPDCQCGYVDPRDNHFARISYDYTFRHTSEANRTWMRELPSQMRIELGSLRALMAHGSPRRVNEFLWESMTPTAFVRRLLDEHDCDLVLVTHTGLPFERWLPEDPRRGLINVGAIGRPANDGRSSVPYVILEATAKPGVALSGLGVQWRQISYDHQALAAEMREEGLPEEFIETVLQGWWTSCLEILPAKERAAGRF